MSKQQIKILNFVKGKSHNVDHYVKDAFVINAECIECTKELISISHKSKRHALKDLFKQDWMKRAIGFCVGIV